MTQPIPDPGDPTVWIIETTDPVMGARMGPQVIMNVHPATACAGRPCVMHNPSGHHKRGWPLIWRDDKRVMERQCPHGIGHPDPDDARYLERRYGAIHASYLLVHGCDGCCRADAPQGSL